MPMTTFSSMLLGLSGLVLVGCATAPDKMTELRKLAAEDLPCHEPLRVTAFEGGFEVEGCGKHATYTANACVTTTKGCTCATS